MTTYLTNAFSPTMLSHGDDTYVKFVSIDLAYASVALSRGFTSGVGHADTAALFSALLDTPVPANRISIKLVPDTDVLVIGQYNGPRLPEGCTVLPEGAEIVWWLAIPTTTIDI